MRKTEDAITKTPDRVFQYSMHHAHLRASGKVVSRPRNPLLYSPTQKALRMGSVRPAWDENRFGRSRDLPTRTLQRHCRGPHHRPTRATNLTAASQPQQCCCPHCSYRRTHPRLALYPTPRLTPTLATAAAAATTAPPVQQQQQQHQQRQRHSSGSSFTPEPRGVGQPPPLRHHLAGGGALPAPQSLAPVLRCSRTEHPVSRALWQHSLIKHWSEEYLAMAPRKKTRASMTIATDHERESRAPPFPSPTVAHDQAGALACL